MAWFKRYSGESLAVIPGSLKDVKEKYTKQPLQLTDDDLANIEEHKKFNFGIETANLENISDVALKYPEISLDFLSMKDRQGFPKFAAFSLESGICKFTVKSGFRTGDQTYFNHKQYLGKYYDYVFGAMKNMINARWEDSYNLTLEQKFNTLIPLDVKKNIKQAYDSGDFHRHEIFIISESFGWTFNSKVIKGPEPVDPLVVGLHNSMWYLIDSFDLSSIEDMVKKEFTS